MAAAPARSGAVSLLLLGATLLADPAAAQERVLRAVPAAGPLVSKARSARAVQTAHPECTAEVLRGRTPEGYLCQVRVLAAEADTIAVPASPAPKSNSALKRRAALAAAACNLGAALAAYHPVNARSGLDRERFAARALGCRAVGSLYDALVALPAGSAVTSALEGDVALPAGWAGKPLKDVVCGCGREAAHLGEAAFISPDDALLNTTQRDLYARGCFLDVKAGSSSLVDLKRVAPGTGPSSAPDAASDRASVVRQYVQSHEAQYKHCAERARGRRPTEPAKLESCMCDVVTRWRLPKADPGSPAREVSVATSAGSFDIGVEASGQVASCHLKGSVSSQPASAPAR